LAPLQLYNIIKTASIWFFAEKDKAKAGIWLLLEKDKGIAGMWLLLEKDKVRHQKNGWLFLEKIRKGSWSMAIFRDI
jgi:hypothetical protein